MIDMRRQLYAIWARLCAGSLDYIGGADPLPQPLTREEEAELLQKLPTDDGTVRSILIERNLRLVVFIARKFESSGVGLEDLISIGTIGLIKAVNTFDPEKKNKLATYASRCIENEMLMHLRHTARIRYEISLDEPLRKDWDGNELLLSDILGTESDLVYRRMDDKVEKQLLRAAREEFIRGNLRLVLSVVQRFSNRGENADDLFQVGCIGLIKALDNFDVTQNVRFSTYAVPMIIGEIRRYLRDNNPIRVSRSLRDTAYKALQARDRLVAEMNREPSVGEIAKALDVPEEDVVLALEAIQDPVSLFEPIYNDGGDAIYIIDQVKDPRHTDSQWLENLAVSEALRRLTEREQSILRMRFFEGRTQMEVAGEIGISQAQVSRLEKNALQHMRKYVSES